ncbi:hypothetical protein CAPTEDRAFT_30795, partial [Capitella teleta]
LSVGSVVLIQEDHQPRLYWRLARVEKLLPGADGHVRCVQLRTDTGVLVRPV